MWETLCENNINLFLLGFGLLLLAVAAVVVSWSLTDKLWGWCSSKIGKIFHRESNDPEVKSVPEEPVPEVITKEREAWEELLNIVKFNIIFDWRQCDDT